MSAEQLTYCFGLDIGTALSQHNECDKRWSQLILGSASTVCCVNYHKLLVEPLPTLVCSWEISLQQFAVGQDCTKVNLGYLAVQGIPSAHIFEYLFQLGAWYVMQIEGFLFLKHESLFTRQQSSATRGSSCGTLAMWPSNFTILMVAWTIGYWCFRLFISLVTQAHTVVSSHFKSNKIY